MSLFELTAPTHVLGGRLKRIFDLVVGLCAAVLALPLFLCIAAILKLTNPGPLLYEQTRVGFGGSRFRCLKFRTMIAEADKALQALLDADPDARANGSAAKNWSVIRGSLLWGTF
jgi:exopolysaccharide production protein ExoY